MVYVYEVTPFQSHSCPIFLSWYPSMFIKVNTSAYVVFLSNKIVKTFLSQSGGNTTDNKCMYRSTIFCTHQAV